MTEDYESMTVAQLKELLKEQGLPVSGKKSDLVARLQDATGQAEDVVEDEAPVEAADDDNWDDFEVIDGEGTYECDVLFLSPCGDDEDDDDDDCDDDDVSYGAWFCRDDELFVSQDCNQNYRQCTRRASPSRRRVRAPARLPSDAR